MTAMDARPAHMANMSGHGNLNQQHGGITQSQEPLSIKTDVMENYYIMVPGQRQLPANGPQHPFYAQNQFSAVGQQFQSPDMNQTMWPSPRSSVDEFDNYSYRGQAAPTSYQPAAWSPRSWPSTTPPAGQFNLPYRPQEQLFDGLTSDHMTMAQDDMRGANVHISLDYGNGSFTQDLEGHLDDESINYESPAPVNTPGSPYSASPASITEVSGPKLEAVSTGSPVASPTNVAGTVTTNAKADGDEPYARLIWKALKSQDSRSMTLQQIYQWFRDNTDKPEKAKAEAKASGNGDGRGWQNSIRHNLSMNQAFVRTEKAMEYHGGAHASEKKLSEWCLVPKFEEGVQPTTTFRGAPRHGSARSRARSNNSPPRPRSSHYPFPDHRTLPGRAVSGRKGGRATSTSRNAAKRNRSLPSPSSPVGPGPNYQEPQQLFVTPKNGAPPYWTTVSARVMDAYHRLARNPDDAEAAAIIKHDSEETRRRNAEASARFWESRRLNSAQQLGATVPTQGAGNSSGENPARQQPYQFPQYTMADVAGVYNHQQHQLPAPQVQQPQPQPQADSVLYGWANCPSHASRGL